MSNKQTTNPTRDNLRGKIFSSANKRGQTKVVSFNGVDIEIHQPTVAQLEAMMKADSEELLNIVPILMDYAYVPGTDEKIFEDSDADMIRNMPFTPEMASIVKVLESFINLEVDTAVKN